MNADVNGSSPPLARRLDGKVALITGGTMGIGKAIAQRFAHEGATLSICARSIEALKATASELEGLGANVYYQPCDVSSKEEMQSLVDNTVEKFGTIDILVNNAALMSVPMPFEDWDDEFYHAMISATLDSVFFMMRYVFPHMKEKGGKIVNVSSLGGIRGASGAGGYAGAKMGVVGLTRAAAHDWGKYGINVNCIAPLALSDKLKDYVDTLPEGTDLFEALNLRRNALGRFGDVSDIAPAVAFLCSEDAGYITGALLPLDGGLMDVE